MTYALRARLSDVHDAVWAARQLYEAGGDVVHLTAAHQTHVCDLAQEAPVQLLLQGLESVLLDVERGALGQSRRRAEEGDAALMAFYEGR